MQALQAGTEWAAQCLGMDSDIGTLEPGKLADLIVVHGDPLHDISMLEDLSRIKLVMQGGSVCVDRRVEQAVTV
jgi:imidazolonepropionase-like amidohydrolase